MFTVTVAETIVLVTIILNGMALLVIYPSVMVHAYMETVPDPITVPASIILNGPDLFVIHLFVM